MLPIRSKSIFKSRWIALAWAGGIIWSAMEFASAHTPHPPARPGNSAQASAPSDQGASDVGEDDSDTPSAADIAAAKQAMKAFDAIH